MPKTKKEEVIEEGSWKEVVAEMENEIKEMENDFTLSGMGDLDTEVEDEQLIDSDEEEEPKKKKRRKPLNKNEKEEIRQRLYGSVQLEAAPTTLMSKDELKDLKKSIKAILRDRDDKQDLRIRTISRKVNQDYREWAEAHPDIESKMTQDQKTKFRNAMQKLRAKRLKLQFRMHEMISPFIESKPMKYWPSFLKQVCSKYYKNLYEYLQVRECYNSIIAEKEMDESIAQNIVRHPLWIYYLGQIRGIGPIGAARIITTLDLDRAKHVSSFWKFTGLDVVIDPETGEGQGRSKKKEHLIRRKYINKEGKEDERDSVTYDPRFKSSLMGVICGNLMKQNAGYKKIYDDYRYRKTVENDTLDPEKKRTKAHIHKMALRYMGKVFLKDLFINWRKLEG